MKASNSQVVAASYLALEVGAYRLALETTAVVSVRQNEPLERDGQCSVTDLAAHFDGKRARDVVPYAVTMEAGGHLLALGVDRVRHFTASSTTGGSLAVPRFGLDRVFFAGGVRHEGSLLLIIDPRALADLLRGSPADAARQG